LQLLERLSQTALVLWVAESAWGYPIVLTMHAIGMALVVGIVVMFDLRVVGFANRIPLNAFRAFARVAWLGLVINVVSGTLLFCANYTAFLHNTAFVTKIALLCAAAFTTWGVARTLDRTCGSLVISSSARALATAGLVLLVGAIVAGRIIGYTSVPE
jgi:hypothetical protein